MVHTMLRLQVQFGSHRKSRFAQILRNFIPFISNICCNYYVFFTTHCNRFYSRLNYFSYCQSLK